MPFLKKLTLVVLATAAVGSWSLVFGSAQAGTLDVYFLDVGEGDAIFIQTPSGNQMLVDGGPSDAVLRRLRSVMPPNDTSIDIVLPTHPNADHIAGLISVMKEYKVGRVLESGALFGSETQKEFQQLVASRGITRVVIDAGDRVALDEGVFFDIFAPYAKVRGVSVENANDAMVIGKLSYGKSALLLTGDMERPDEIALSLSNANLKSGILKVAHHGSKYSSTNLFLERVLPAIAVISVGKNYYGHPHAETMGRLQRIGAQLLRTDKEGTIHFRSSGGKFSMSNQFRNVLLLPK